MTLAQLNRARRLLCGLQDHIRDAILAARMAEGASFAEVAAVTVADTIYRVDKVSEEAILEWFERNWPRAWPVEVVMEGLEDREVTFPLGTPLKKTGWKCILDPIDGTRGLMYDKRPAWSLAGLAPQRGAKTNLRDIVVAAMTELPTSKQWRADQVSAVRGQGVIAEMVDVRAANSAPPRKGGENVSNQARVPRPRFAPHPSVAKDFRHGFSSFARYFPEGKGLLGSFEEAVWAELHGADGRTQPLVFDDQYISTGGQIYELLVGHDRMVADLRPLAFKKLGLESALVCHPYDISTALILMEVGGVVEKPLGGALNAPLDTTSPVAWIGYANKQLAGLARPVIRRLIKRELE